MQSDDNIQLGLEEKVVCVYESKLRDENIEVVAESSVVGTKPLG